MFRFRVYCELSLFLFQRACVSVAFFSLRDSLISEGGDCENDIVFKSILGKLNDLKIDRILRYKNSKDLSLR